MSWKQDRGELESVQERVREKYNPGWRQQLRMHRETLGLDPETGEKLHVEQPLLPETGQSSTSTGAA